MKLIIRTIIACFLIWFVCVNAGMAQADSSPAAPSVAQREGSQAISITRSGSQPASKGSAEYFTGSVTIKMLFTAHEPSRTTGGLVTFQPGARTAWHSHPLGQTLIVTAGIGRIQQWDGPIEEIRQGDVVRIPPGVKHWHGAAPNSAMTHIAIQESLDGKTADWKEQVNNEQYGPDSAPRRANHVQSKSLFRCQRNLTVYSQHHPAA